jgi:hypothetical protein
MKLLLPAVFGVFFASGLCCCGGILEKLGVPLPGLSGAPEELAAFAPFPGSTYTVGATSGNVSTASYESKGASASEVITHYKKQASSAGFTLGQEYVADGNGTMQATKGSERFTAVASAQNDGLVIVISLEK